MTILFISDLHLDPSRPRVTQAFLQLLQCQASTADALYILGDFFEAWIGDDDDSELNQTVISGLKQLTDTGTPVYVMHGNRDFLLGEHFCQQSGCQLIPDPTVINSGGQSLLLMHGDTLCIDDIKYLNSAPSAAVKPGKPACCHSLSRIVAPSPRKCEQKASRRAAIRRRILWMLTRTKWSGSCSNIIQPC